MPPRHQSRAADLWVDMCRRGLRPPNGEQRHHMAIAMAVSPALTMALIITMLGPLADGLLRRLTHPAGRAAPSKGAHACPQSDPCAGSDAGHTWADVDYVSAAGKIARTTIVDEKVRKERSLLVLRYII